MLFNAVATCPVTMEETFPSSKRTSFILIVDDDLAIREMLQMLLEGEGYRIVMASNGKEALEMIRQQRPALILLDLMMPIMDGWQFLDCMKSRPDLQSLPVVLLSANRELARTARQNNVKAYLSKPFETGQLLEYIEYYKEKI